MKGGKNKIFSIQIMFKEVKYIIYQNIFRSDRVLLKLEDDLEYETNTKMKTNYFCLFSVTFEDALTTAACCRCAAIFSLLILVVGCLCGLCRREQNYVRLP